LDQGTKSLSVILSEISVIAKDQKNINCCIYISDKEMKNGLINLETNKTVNY
jgi:hypothetical protein